MLAGKTANEVTAMHRRDFLGGTAALVTLAMAPRQLGAAGNRTPFDVPALRKGWEARLRAIAAKGKVPIIDIESSYNPGKIDLARFAGQMDSLGVGQICMSPQIGKKGFNKGKMWNDGARDAVAAFPDHFIPTSTAGIWPAWTERPDAFLDIHFRRVIEENYPLMGEFEFRHYMSPPEYKRGEKYRDIDIPIDSEPGHRLFKFSEETGLSFQIHYEIEDRLLPPLEKMLSAYPKAKVIWCHLAQIRYQKRSTIYGPDYLRKLLEAHPGLHIDTAFGGPGSIYPDSHEHHARVWGPNGHVRSDWVTLIRDHPWRFLAAFDLGGDRIDEMDDKAKTVRRFLKDLPDDTARTVAHRSAWKLLFDEEIAL